MSLSLLSVSLCAFAIIALIGGLIAVFLLNRNQNDRPSPYTGDLEQDVRALVYADRQIEAIKLVRKQTGLDLAAARDYVRAIDQGAVPDAPTLPAPPMLANQELDPQIRDLLAKGNKIAAVKLVRDHTDLGLREAKDYVDHIERTS